MANTTDVRAWLKETGVEVSDRGKLKREFHDQYDAAHPPAAPGGPGPEAEGDYDLGVSAADFITADEPPERPPAEPAPAAPEGHQDERRPRRVASARPPRRSFRERVWGGGGAKPKRPARTTKRMSLQGLAEDTWLDLAWTFQNLPPLEKILYLQAPLAGRVAEDTIRGTVVDKIAQPIARANEKVKGVEGLTAALWVAAIMMRGRRDETGAYSPETQFMFAGLRHALLSMSRTVEGFDFEAQREKADELRTASGQIDQMIAYIFEMPEMTEEQVQAMAAQQAARAEANGA